MYKLLLLLLLLLLLAAGGGDASRASSPAWRCDGRSPKGGEAALAAGCAGVRVRRWGGVWAAEGVESEGLGGRSNGKLGAAAAAREEGVAV